MTVLIVIVIVLIMILTDVIITRANVYNRAYRRGYTDGRLDELKMHIGEDEDE